MERENHGKSMDMQTTAWGDSKWMDLRIPSSFLPAWRPRALGSRPWEHGLLEIQALLFATRSYERSISGIATNGAIGRYERSKGLSSNMFHHIRPHPDRARCASKLER